VAASQTDIRNAFPRPNRQKLAWLILGLAVDVAIPSSWPLNKIKDAVDDAVRARAFYVQKTTSKLVPYSPIQKMKTPLEIDYELLLLIGLMTGKWPKKTFDEMANALENGYILEPVWFNKTLEKREGKDDKKLDKLINKFHIDNMWT
jgi:hypothetical protein